LAVLIAGSGLLGTLVATLQYPGAGAPSAKGASTVDMVHGITFPAKLQNLPAPPPLHFTVEPGSDALWFPVIDPSGDNHLYQYDSKTDSLASWALPSNPGGGYFVGLGFGRPRQLWIAWDQTLVVFNTGTHEVTTFPIPTASQYELKQAPGKWVRDLVVTAIGTVWLSREHSASLLAFDPVTHAFTEHSLKEFGAPDRIHLSPSGHLWLTLAHDVTTGQEFTDVAVFDPRTDMVKIVHEPASRIGGFDAQGQAILSTPGRFTKADLDGNVHERGQLRAATALEDLVLDLGNDKLVATDRINSGVAVYDPVTTQWTMYKLPTSTGRVIGPPGRKGPSELEVDAAISDMHVDSQGTVWLLNANYNRFVKLQP
jgi:streptogramin lyase